MKENKLNPKARDIILVRGGWTKGKDYMYLVTFSDPDSDWIGVYGIFPAKHTDPGLRIPPEFTNGKLVNGGFVNVFTGSTAIHKDTIIEIVGTLPDDIYERICFKMLSVMLGNWKRGTNGYEVTDMVINIKASISGIEPMRMNFGANRPEGCSVMPKNEFLFRRVLITDAKKHYASIQEPKEEPEKPVENKTKKSSQSSSKTINKLVNEYGKITSCSDRINFIFDEFSIDGYLPLVRAFNLLFNKEETAVGARTIMFNREQFFNLATGTEIAAPSSWRRYNGDMVYKPAIALIKSMSIKASMLYNGYNP